TAYFDGLARSYQGTHLTPDGTAKTDTTFDGLGHATSASNPYYSTTEPTYGVTGSQYDALGRVTQITKQDNGISTVSYNDNCSTATDEAGKQRKSCSDALGRLTEVDEPNPGAAATDATGAIVISGTLKSQSGVGAVNATYGTGSLTIGGTEGSYDSGGNLYCAMWNNDGDCVDWEFSPVITTYDTGTVTLTVNGHPDQVTYGPRSAPDNLAGALANAINSDGAAVVYGSATNGVLSLRSRQTGQNTNYNWSIAFHSDDSSHFGVTGSFSASPGASAL